MRFDDLIIKKKLKGIKTGYNSCLFSWKERRIDVIIKYNSKQWSYRITYDSRFLERGNKNGGTG